MNASKLLTALFLVIGSFTQSCNTPVITYDSKKQDSLLNKPEQTLPGQISEGHPRLSKVYDSTKIENYYPFIIYKDDMHMIAAEIETLDLFNKYGPIFEKHGYSGNGYSWEGHIRQMLQKENPGLLRHLEFDPEAGGFYVYADNEKNQRLFAEFVSKIFQDIPKLENYLKTADRSRISD